jgi:hypothetical protein
MKGQIAIDADAPLNTHIYKSVKHRGHSYRLITLLFVCLIINLQYTSYSVYCVTEYFVIIQDSFECVVLKCKNVTLN